MYGINDSGYGAWDAGWDYERMHTFAWGFDDGGVIDPQLAVVQAAREADEAAAHGQEFEPSPEVLDGDERFEVEEYVEEPLPAFYEAFRRRARINTYTVLGPELALDEYPFFTPPPEGFPTTFGPNSVRTRTLASDQGA